MDVVYQAVETMHYFIPIIAVAVVCGALFFWRGAPDEEEYLGRGTPEMDREVIERLREELEEIEKKDS